MAEGVDADALYAVRKILEDGGANVSIIAPDMQDVRTTGNRLVKVDYGLNCLDSNSSDPGINTVSIAQFDALFIPHGKSVEVLLDNANAVAWVAEAYKRSKVIATSGEAMQLLQAATLSIGITLQPQDLHCRVVEYQEGQGSQFFRTLLRSIAAQCVLEAGNVNTVIENTLSEP